MKKNQKSSLDRLGMTSSSLSGLRAEGPSEVEGSKLKTQNSLKRKTDYRLPTTDYRLRGFTLIEFLVVIAIISILTGFGIPQFASYSKRQTLLKATVHLIDDLKTAQNMALSGVQDEPSSKIVKNFFVEKVDNKTYALKRKLDDDSISVVFQKSLDEPVYIASWPINPNFTVPTGKLVTSCTIRVCYTGVGFYDITVEQSGRIYRGERGAASGC